MTRLPGADCHAHIFCPARYPYASETPYLPHSSQLGTAADLAPGIDAQGLSHGLLVSPEPYGTDNRCVLDALDAYPARFKGIVLVAPDIADRDLDALAERPVVGVRFNLSTHGMRQFDHPATPRLLARLREMAWFLEIHCQQDELVDAVPLLRRAGVRLMIDHFGRPDPRHGIYQPGFAALLELGRSGNAVVKLSGPYRASLQGHPYRDVDPFIDAAIQAFTLDRCVWGSDWPFVRHNARVDYGPELVCVERWLSEERDRRKILWETPKQLFGFV
jgi:predicted TIM-barrel fold metal-dependent hydrolase